MRNPLAEWREFTTADHSRISVSDYVISSLYHLMLPEHLQYPQSW